MIENVIKNELCLGCGICESSFGADKIKVTFNEEGYLRPQQYQPLSKKENARFKQICPGINVKHESTSSHHPLWGPLLSIRSGFSTNNDIRNSGSSGGVLTSIASYLIENNKVECIVHIGPSSEQPYKNEVKVSYTSNEITSNAGSRYAPSATLINIIQILEKHDSLAIIGKPCDIVGVRNLMKTNQEAKVKIKFLLSFMCAGIPSQNATTDIMNEFNVSPENVSSLKYRGDGWPGYFKIEEKSGETHKMSYNESWGTILNKKLQFRCKICADGTGEFADITCADAWVTTKKGYPSFQERNGQSLIITRNNDGENLLNEATKAGYLKISRKNITEKEVGKMQPYQKARKQNLLPRLAALKFLGRTVPKFNYNRLFIATARENPFRLLKNFLGMLRRAWKS